MHESTKVVTDQIARLESLLNRETQRRHWEGLFTSSAVAALALLAGFALPGLLGRLLLGLGGWQVAYAAWHLEYLFTAP